MLVMLSLISEHLIKIISSVLFMVWQRASIIMLTHVIQIVPGFEWAAALVLSCRPWCVIHLLILPGLQVNFWMLHRYNVHNHKSSLSFLCMGSGISSQWLTLTVTFMFVTLGNCPVCSDATYITGRALKHSILAIWTAKDDSSWK